VQISISSGIQNNSRDQARLRHAAFFTVLGRAERAVAEVRMGLQFFVHVFPPLLPALMPRDIERLIVDSGLRTASIDGGFVKTAVDVLYFHANSARLG